MPSTDALSIPQSCNTSGSSLKRVMDRSAHRFAANARPASMGRRIAVDADDARFWPQLLRDNLRVCPPGKRQSTYTPSAQPSNGGGFLART